jgi:hypothetical protein
VCARWRVARAPGYARRVGATGLHNVARIRPQPHARHSGRDPSPPSAPPGRKRGLQTPADDAAVLTAIRAVLAARPVHPEGHRKVRVRLRGHGIRVGKARVLRVMREGRLLGPTRPGQTHGDRTHAGTITTQPPDAHWGTGATLFSTRREGWCWFFGAIDHGVEDVGGWPVAKGGDR